MSEVTKQIFTKIYLEKINNEDYVDWAIDCLEDGFDSTSLRELAGLNKNHSINADFEELFNNSLNELGWKFLNEKEVLLNYSKDLAKKILSSEIEAVEGSELINKIYHKLSFPKELENWSYIDGGHSSEWYDRSRWFPFIQKFNHKKWLSAVMKEANDLLEIKIS